MIHADFSATSEAEKQADPCRLRGICRPPHQAAFFATLSRLTTPDRSIAVWKDSLSFMLSRSVSSTGVNYRR